MVSARRRVQLERLGFAVALVVSVVVHVAVGFFTGFFSCYRYGYADASYQGQVCWESTTAWTWAMPSAYVVAALVTAVLVVLLSSRIGAWVLVLGPVVSVVLLIALIPVWDLPPDQCTAEQRRESDRFGCRIEQET